jgi:glycosyltransferase involved in cell wall biosynthesis
MKVSIVIAVLDSHEIVKRQLLYFRRLDLPDDVEIIIVDDGSSPPIQAPDPPLKNTTLIETKDKRRWTQGLARMKGIGIAKGEYVFCTDIDHIISKEAIEFARSFDGDKAIFQRRFAYLDGGGILVTDRDKVIAWGLLPRAIRDSNLSDGVHGNTWLMRRSLFIELGGYDLRRCNSGTHLQGEDRKFNSVYSRAVREGRAKAQIAGPAIYFFPMGKYHVNGDDNPHGLFHILYKEKWGDAKTK